MVSFRSLALLAAATLVTAQDVATLEACGQTCYNSMTAQFATYNCASAADLACLCKVEAFKNGAESCAKESCPDPNYSSTVLAAVNNACAAAIAAPPAPSATSTPPAPSTPAPTTPTTTEAPPPASTTSSSSSSSTTASEAAKLTSATTSSSTSTATKTASSTGSSTTAAAPAATTSSAPAAGPAEGSLSTATKIGIAVGAIAAAGALIGVIICMLLRRRQNKRDIGAATKNWKISEPMPVSGRAYGHDYSNSYETGLSDLEMKSRRYEDMLPRQVPRQMV